MAKSIGISAFFRQDQLAGGAYSVFENLLSGFSTLCEDPATRATYDITVFHGQAKIPRRHKGIQWREIPDRWGRFPAEISLALRHARNKDALLFLNYFTPPIIRSGRAVTIIHDLQYRHMPELYTASKRLWLRACHEMTLRKCHRVIAISNAVKQDILRQYGDRWSDRIDVIWNPVSLDRLNGVCEQTFTNGRPYLFCVAVDRPQKNLFRLIRAFSQLADRFPDHCLVLAGQLRSLRRSRRERSVSVGRLMPSTVDVVEELSLQDRVRITGFISDQQLGSLYRGADLFVLPSLFEGFGMPAVESLLMGTPTLVSGLPVLREVTLESACYLDNPEDVSEMADKMATMLNAPAAYRPTPETIQRVRDSFAPPRIAEQYLKTLAS